MKSILVPLAFAALLAGCNQETPPPQPPLPKTDAPAAQESRLPERTRAGIDTLNKAKDVEGVVQRQAAEQEQAVNRQTGQ